MQPYLLSHKPAISIRCRRYLKSIYTLAKTIRKDGYWILADSKHHADDNAEHFYRYLLKNQPQKNIIFLLSTKAPDWPRLEKEGFQLVAFSRHIVSIAMKYATTVLASHTDLIEQYFYVPKVKFIYLGHGVKKDDDSTRIGNLKVNIVVTGSFNEYKNLSANKPESWSHVALTGLPRHDALIGSEKSTADVVLLMPTWRKYISRERKHRSWAEGMEQGFFHAWASLLNSARLKEIAKEHGYEVCFLPHRGVSRYSKLFHCPKHINLLTYDNLMIQDVFKKSRVLITDFSSVAFDMAYLRKSVIYYHFDHEKYRNFHYKEGYFNYEKDGFGPVCHSVVEVTKALQEAINSRVPAKQYLGQMQKFFPDRDGNNCKRLYDFIITTYCESSPHHSIPYEMSCRGVKVLSS